MEGNTHQQTFGRSELCLSKISSGSEGWCHFWRAMVKILGLPSCLHKHSSSRQLLHLIKEVGGSDWSLDIADLSGLPLFNRDIQESLSFRKSQVETFRNHVEEADAFIFCASEAPLGYAYSVSTPLKNAIDWAVIEPNLFSNKPAAFIGASCFQYLFSPTCSCRWISNFWDQLLSFKTAHILMWTKLP